MGYGPQLGEAIEFLFKAAIVSFVTALGAIVALIAIAFGASVTTGFIVVGSAAIAGVIAAARVH